MIVMFYNDKLFVLIIRLPPRTTLTYTLLPNTTLFRSHRVSGVPGDVVAGAEIDCRGDGSLGVKSPVRSRDVDLAGEGGKRHGATVTGDRKSTRLNSSH